VTWTASGRSPKASRSNEQISAAARTEFGVVGEYWTDFGRQTVDERRFQEAKVSSNKRVFKVRTLQNVAMTPPHFPG